MVLNYFVSSAITCRLFECASMSGILKVSKIMRVGYSNCIEERWMVFLSIFPYFVSTVTATAKVFDWSRLRNWCLVQDKSSVSFNDPDSPPVRETCDHAGINLYAVK